MRTPSSHTSLTVYRLLPRSDVVLFEMKQIRWESDMRRSVSVCFSAVLIVITAACNTAGPRGLKSSAVAYNHAVAQTNGEQLLLNLVRLRYRDVPVFLEISSISSQYQFSTSAGLAFGLGRPSGDKSYGGSAGFGFSEKPTISFNPLRGEAFVKQMMSPIPPETVTLLFHSGWNFDRVARVVVQRINGVDNAPSASSPTPSLAPEYKDFKRGAQLLKTLQKRNELELGVSTDDDGKFYLRVTEEGRQSAELAEAASIFDFPPGMAQYEVIPSVLKAPPGKIGINMRSLSGVLYFLSQGVEAPAEHEEAGLVTVTRLASGERFDWAEVCGDLLRIQSSASQPDNAAIRVKYRGHWFFIADNDLNSKSTFSLLSQITALQAGGVPSAGPVMTLPLG